jgi:hypothetical protein
MIHFLAPIAIVSYCIAAIVGSCFAIILSAAWCAIDKAVTRLALRQRARRPRATTIVRVGGRRDSFS